MARMSLMAMLLCAPLAAFAADDFRAIQLEQEIRYLQQQLQVQAQQMAELRRQLARPAEPQPPAAPFPPAGQPGSRAPVPAAPAVFPAWVDAAKWRQVQTGMGELEVITVLGPPTSMRTEDGARVLLYAMEIGANGFLSGRVTLRERVVTEVQQPTLR